MATPTTNLEADVSARFRAVNGDHPMTEADDAYVNRTHVTLDELCADRTETADDVRADMLAQRLPLPSYLRTDGTEMVPVDYFRLADEAGGVEELPTWFARHWTDRAHAAAEWRAYLDGQYVCLRAITPAAMQRKDELTDAITDHMAQPRDTPSWPDRLNALVDELDGLLAEFTDYDRLRFGGPVSRDRFVTDIRASRPDSFSGTRCGPSVDQ
ncbi:MAG TPA: DUF6058 family natural product biosynthesis protein [Pseudonocardiaceae bacterium]|nr:DUF6058 family natural product biosynthesis protein [Pseudonocardiaceae bacterium]